MIFFLTLFLAYLLTFFLASLLTFILAFYLAYLLTYLRPHEERQEQEKLNGKSDVPFHDNSIRAGFLE